MKITDRIINRTDYGDTSDRNRSRRSELAGLLVASTLVITGLYLVYQAKAANKMTPFDKVPALLKEKRLVNLNSVQDRNELIASLETVSISRMFDPTNGSDQKSRITTVQIVADQLIQFFSQVPRQSVSSIVSAEDAPKVSRKEIDAGGDWVFLQPRLERVRLLATKDQVNEWLRNERLAANQQKIILLDELKDKYTDPLYTLASQDGKELLYSGLDDYFDPFAADSDREVDDASREMRVNLHDQILRTIQDSYKQIQEIELDRPVDNWLVTFQHRIRRLFFTSAPVQPGTLTLLSRRELRDLRPAIIVRTPEEFRAQFLLYGSLAILVFYLIHIIWRWRGFSGDTVVLPVVHFLSGLGVIMMVSLRDPLRDALLFQEFCQGIVFGGGLLLLLSQIDLFGLAKGVNGFLHGSSSSNYLYGLSKLTADSFRRGAYYFLYAALGLAVLLSLFGSAPGEAGESGVRVNLGPFQPVEMIKILVIMFLAGYFHYFGELLRGTRQRGESRLLSSVERFNLPKFVYFLPVVLAISLILTLFFAIKDLGPALVLATTFLTLYYLVRNKPVLALLGAGLFIAALGLSYAFQAPIAVFKRVMIWKDPWTNGLRGGDQVAHSIWALSSGGLTGEGLGQGLPALIPAGHTDLILSSVGEELGFPGVLTVLGLYAVLIYRGFKISRQAEDVYCLLLGSGLTLLTVWQMLLIVSGILGIFPLSGVVSPFLSQGRSSMLANFAIFGILLAISSRRRTDFSVGADYTRPMKVTGGVLICLVLVIVARVYYIQLVNKTDYLIAGALTKQADDEFRFQYNPRLSEAIKLLPMGTIFDRNDIPLATSSWAVIQQNKSLYQEIERDFPTLNVDVDQNSHPTDSRHYPLGESLFYLLGRTREVIGGRPNVKFAQYVDYVEDTYSDLLHGYRVPEKSLSVSIQNFDQFEQRYVEETKEIIYRNYEQLLPLLLHRNNLNEEAKALINKPRDLHLTIDVRYQLAVTKIMQDRLNEIDQQLKQIKIVRREIGGRVKDAEIEEFLPPGQRRGAAVVLDVKTGEILASVSYPVIPLNCKKCGRLNLLLDRARFDRLRPGSIQKIMTTIAAVRKDPQLLDRRYDCQGKVIFHGKIVHEIPGDPIINRAGVGFDEALKRSGDVYFAQLGLETGKEMMRSTAQIYGIQLEDAEAPLSDPKRFAQASYGMAGVKASPLAMAQVASTIANDGVLAPAKIIRGLHQESQTVVGSGVAQRIASAMNQVVKAGGTAAQLDDNLAGKTGTANITDTRIYNSNFIGFSSYDRRAPRIAFAVMIPGVKRLFGAQAAAPIAEDLIRAWENK